MFDILLRNGIIIDGTGKSSYNGDIGIKDGKIIDIGKKIDEAAIEIIDASGLMVSPGFIDVHSHNDLVPLMDNKIKNLKLMQGVTTELTGQCGLGVVPCIENESKLWKNYVRGVVGDLESDWTFNDLNDYFNQIEGIGLKNNFAVLLSHGAVRSFVMGFDRSIPNSSQLRSMCGIVEDAMKNGAFGMSIGLQYMPGVFSCREELIALCRIIKEYDGVIMVHLRNHDDTIINALDEIISIAGEAKVKLHISHLRSYDSDCFGQNASNLIKVIEEAVENGVKISFDEHLYLSGSTLLTQLLPPWITGDGTDELLSNLGDNEKLNRVKEELASKVLRYRGWDNYSAVAGFDGILITSVKKPENQKYVGRTVGEISEELGLDPVDFIAQLLIAEQGGVGIVTLNIFSEKDTINLIKHPLQMVGSDSIPAGVPHPRLYGNYPLFIGKYVRDLKAISIEQAIYKCTLLPAETLGLRDLGELKIGNTADIILFDFDEINGYEDYRNSTRSPKGIRYVILNGNIAVNDGNINDEKFGRVLKHQYR